MAEPTDKGVPVSRPSASEEYTKASFSPGGAEKVLIRHPEPSLVPKHHITKRRLMPRCTEAHPLLMIGLAAQYAKWRPTPLGPPHERGSPVVGQPYTAAIAYCVQR